MAWLIIKKQRGNTKQSKRLLWKNKERLRDQQKVNIETYLKNIRIKKKNMEKTDIIICLKKKQKLKKYQKKYREAAKSLYNNDLIVI